MKYTSHADTNAPSIDLKLRRRRWLKIAGGSGTLLLIPLLALAANPRGCVMLPHGTPFQVNRAAGITTFAMRVGGKAADNATKVVVQAGTPVRNPNGVASVTWQNLGPDAGIPKLNPDAGYQEYDMTVNVPLAIWPKDGTLALRVRETGGGTTQTQDTVGQASFPTPHQMIGAVDLPNPSDFPSLEAFPPNVTIKGQTPAWFLSAKGNTDGGGQLYYGAIAAPATFAAWKTRNGFPASPNVNTEAIAYYRNENDLGFGREMRCRIVEFAIVASKIACYVTNYPNETLAASGAKRTATVAMEWKAGGFLKPGTQTPELHPSETVRFFVYDTGVDEFADVDKDGLTNDLVTRIALDGGGPKDVPQLCLNCHGGSHVAATTDSSKKTAVGSRFLPWDVDTLPVPSSKGAQAAEFKELNQLAFWVEWGDQRQRGPLVELLTGWYGGTIDNPEPLIRGDSPFNGNFIPAGWLPTETDPGNRAMYLGLVAPYCRSCHIAQPAREFNTLAMFKGNVFAIHRNVCDRSDPTRFMPHAQRTFQKFWQSGAPAYVALDMGGGPCQYSK